MPFQVNPRGNPLEPGRSLLALLANQPLPLREHLRSPAVFLTAPFREQIERPDTPGVDLTAFKPSFEAWQQAGHALPDNYPAEQRAAIAWVRAWASAFHPSTRPEISPGGPQPSSALAKLCS